MTFFFFADGASLISGRVPGRRNWNFLVFLENLGTFWALIYRYIKYIESKLLSRKKEVAYK